MPHSDTGERPLIVSAEQSKIARSLADVLKNPAESGTRHTQMKLAVCPLLEIGLSDEAVFTQFRGMYAADLSDAEINQIIAWGRKRVDKDLKPANGKAKVNRLTATEANAEALKWLDGFKCDEASLWDASPIRPLDDAEPLHDSILLLSYVFQPRELICINTRFHVTSKKQGEKVTILGPGETKTAAEWIEHIKFSGTPQRRAGAWIRLNPLSKVYGSGEGGAHTDADVASFRYLLVESDLLEPEVTLSVYGKVRFPIAAIIDSAGRGPRAWFTLNAANAEEFAALGKEIFDCLSTIGFDSGNSNPSRYGRFAGAKRLIGAREGSLGFQRLLYLAPHLKREGIFL
jgi:hypothetical protein